MRQFGRVVSDVHKNKLCQLWRYWTEFREIFKRYRGIIYTVNALNEVALYHSVSDKCRMGR